MANNGYSQDFIAKLKSSNNIVSIISRYVPLQRKGRTYWGCCPFHHEKTPSFQVNEYEGFYHCFGCGESGDVISFTQKIEGIDFMQTVKNLAENAGLELPEFTGDENIIRKKKEKDRLIYICTETAKYYHSELLKDSGKIARDYLDKRQITQDTITKMGLGYSPSWQGLIDYLLSLKISKQEMLNAGVVQEKNGKLYDAMATRLVFPIFDHVGKVVGFSGRDLTGEALAKYKNTSATEVFNKSTILFGLNNLRKARVQNKNYAILVEGQIDVVSLYQAGFPNAIASLGTAFNENHIDTISKFVDSIYICFDGDGAGKKATEKCVELLKNTNFDVKILSLPDKLDPDEYIKNYGAEKFEEQLKNAKTVKEFQIENMAEKYDLNDKNQVTKFVENALNLIASFKSVTDRDLYLKKVAQKSNLNEEILRRELNKKVNLLRNSRTQEKINTKVTNENQTKNRLLKAEIFVLSCRLYKRDFANNIASDLFDNNFCKTFNQYIIDNNPIVSQVIDDYDMENNDILNQIIKFDFDKIKDEKSEYKDCVKQLELRRLYEKQTNLQIKLQTAKDKEKIALLNKLQQTILEIQSKKAEE